MVLTKTPEKNRRSLDISHINLAARCDGNDDVPNRIKHVPSASVLSVASRSSKISHKAINAVRRLSKFHDKRMLSMQQTMTDLGRRLTVGKLLQRRL